MVITYYLSVSWSKLSEPLSDIGFCATFSHESRLDTVAGFGRGVGLDDHHQPGTRETLNDVAVALMNLGDVRTGLADKIFFYGCASNLVLIGLYVCSL